MIYKKKKVEPPCEECIPELFPENKDAFDVYIKCQNQTLQSNGGVIDINFVAINVILDIFEIENKQSVFEKVVTAFHHFLSIDREKEKKNNAK